MQIRSLLPVIFLLLTSPATLGQESSDLSEGTVSYITSQSIYVKFESTGKFSAGDTLFGKTGENLVPVLIIRDLSSISCVCVPVGNTRPVVGDKVWHRNLRKPPATADQPKAPIAPPPVKVPDSVPGIALRSDSITPAKPETAQNRQRIHGYLAIASYSGFSDYEPSNSQRFKYTLSLLARNIANTGLSAECYATFNQNNEQWDEIKSNLFNGLKIYSLAVNYDFGNRASLLLGRKINPKLSNMGPNDGLQFELRFKPLTVGLIAGFRPDTADFGFNAGLFQYGAYLYNEYGAKHGMMQTTLAFVQQTNDWKTDRRYLYLQHVNSLVKNLTFFGSAEMDLFRLELNEQDSAYTSSNKPQLSNLYLSLSYRFQRKLYTSFSYSARKYIIFYETYRNYLDRLLDPDMWQGYSLQVSYNPVALLSVGVTGAYRYMPQDPKDSKNLYAYVTYSQIPGIGISSTVSFTMLSTSYIRGNIYSLGISRNFAKNKVSTGLAYRYVDYDYYTEGKIPQNLFEANLTWRIWKRIAVSAYYEGTFEKVHQYNRIYAQLRLGF